MIESEGRVGGWVAGRVEGEGRSGFVEPFYPFPPTSTPPQPQTQSCQVKVTEALTHDLSSTPTSTLMTQDEEDPFSPVRFYSLLL